ncbi:MAG: hypothetical protein AAFQ95_10610 [Cyanobacteria bacterium J06621_3]
MKKILILTANPKNSDKLRLDEEVREIQEGLQRFSYGKAVPSRSRDQFEIIAKWAVRPDDLRRALLDHEPNIVHFSGHGAEENGFTVGFYDGLEARWPHSETLEFGVSAIDLEGISEVAMPQLKQWMKQQSPSAQGAAETASAEDTLPMDVMPTDVASTVFPSSTRPAEPTDREVYKALGAEHDVFLPFGIV